MSRAVVVSDASALFPGGLDSLCGSPVSILLGSYDAFHLVATQNNEKGPPAPSQYSHRGQVKCPDTKDLSQPLRKVLNTLLSKVSVQRSEGPETKSTKSEAASLRVPGVIVATAKFLSFLIKHIWRVQIVGRCNKGH